MTDVPANDQARAWTFDELVHAGLSIIPAYAPSWTNHNPSDPGITLLELLAYFSEILAYRALRITPDAKLHFLRLLEDPAASSSDALIGAPSHVIEAAIAARVQALSHLECAVTPGDFERLAITAAATHPEATTQVLAKCVPGIDLRHMAVVDAPADVSVVLYVDRQSTEHLCRHVETALTPSCLLTTRAHVVPASLLDVFVTCRLSPMPGVSPENAAEVVDAALQRRFDPLRPDPLSPDADGGPFGRPVHLATVAAAIDRVAEVDYVENITVRRIATAGAMADPLVGIRIGIVSTIGENTRLGGWASIALRRLQTDHTGEAETVFLQPWELAHVRLDVGSAVTVGTRRRG